jgi:hypothetical protein
LTVLDDDVESDVEDDVEVSVGRIVIYLVAGINMMLSFEQFVNTNSNHMINESR